MTTFTQPSKNISSFSQPNRGDSAVWGDDIALWGDSFFTWGFMHTTFTKPTKNIATFTQPTKN
jgi:hypothetical protein